MLQSLDEAVPLLRATDDFVLGLPVAAVLAATISFAHCRSSGVSRNDSNPD